MYIYMCVCVCVCVCVCFYIHIQKVVGKICRTIHVDDNVSRHILDIILHNNDWCHL